MVVGSSFLSASRNCSFSVMLASSPDTSLKLTDFAGCRQPSRGPFFLDVIYTIGHSTRELGEFLGLLAAHRVTQVVDVRRYPASRRHPQFARDTLAMMLEEAGIRYHHEPDLGGRRAARRDSANTAWRSAGFRGYADHPETPQLAGGVAPPPEPPP